MTVEDVLEILRARGLVLIADEVDESGLDFFVVHAHDPRGTRWIARAARRPDVIAAARHEAHVLELVRDELPIAIPDWRVRDGGVIAYPRLEGTPAVTFEGGAPRWTIDPADPPAAFLDAYARTIGALWRVEVDGRVKLEDVADARASIARAMETTRAALAPSEPVWARWQRWIEDDGAWPTHTALVHGDLHPGHMLLDAEGRLTAVLDWTEARFTDPSVDLAMFHGGFGRRALEEVIARLERVGAVTWPRLADHACERWAAFPALIAQWALGAGSEPVMAHARMQLASITRDTA